MLKPADGVQGVKDFVLDTVRQAGANPCPPIVLGVGIGGSFDSAPPWPKRPCCARWTSPTPDPYYAALEAELKDAVNAIGHRPAGASAPHHLPGGGHPADAHPCGLPAGGGQRQAAHGDPPGQRGTVTSRTTNRQGGTAMALKGNPNIDIPLDGVGAPAGRRAPQPRPHRHPTGRPRRRPCADQPAGAGDGQPPPRRGQGAVPPRTEGGISFAVSFADAALQSGPVAAGRRRHGAFCPVWCIPPATPPMPA